MRFSKLPTLAGIGVCQVLCGAVVLRVEAQQLPDPITSENYVSYTSEPPDVGAADPFAFLASGAQRFAVTNLLSGTVSSADDLSANWSAVYDEDYLYVFVDVDDDQRGGSPGPLWQDDSIEVYVDPDYSRGTEYDGINDYQLVVWGSPPAFQVGVNSVQSTEGVLAGAHFVMPRSSLDYVVAVGIPWTTLGVTPVAGMPIGLDVHVNDNDAPTGMREGKVGTFATTDDAWHNPSLFGTFVLGEPKPLPIRIPNGSVPYAINADGVAAEPGWQYTPVHQIEKALLGAPSSPQDVSARWRAVWDGTALYFWVEVQDDNFVRDSGDAPWHDDSIEIFVDADGNSTNYGPHVAQFIFRVFDETVRAGTATTVSPSYVRAFMHPSDTGYMIEVGIPWTAFGLSTPNPLIAVDVHVNDDQNGGSRETKLATFASSDRSWIDPTLFRKAYLSASLYPNR